jgi:hypothetical protein
MKLSGAEIDTLYKLHDNYPLLVEPGDLPSKVGCAGLVKLKLAAYMYGGSAVLLPAGNEEYVRRRGNK